jgi:ABC-2 type transport system ATP-binding protein
VSPDELRAEVKAPVEASGNQLSITTGRPQTALYRLTGWAEREGIELAGLEVRRPSLEDVFLELTGGRAGDGDG